MDRKYSIVSLPSTSFSHVSLNNAPGASEEEPELALPDMVLLQDALREADEAIKKAEESNSRNERRKAKERREDIVRLMRVEILYVRVSSRLFELKVDVDWLQKAMLPQMQAWVIVLLKLLLATVTATGANPPSANPSGFPSALNGMLDMFLLDRSMC